jgi:hypothetical protein
MAILTGVKAQGTLTRAATTDLLADGDTITLGSVTYRWKSTTAQANDIFLAASSDAGTIAGLNSLAKILNGTGTVAASGADAYTGTVQPSKEFKAGTCTSLTQVFTALMPGTAGNNLAFSEVIVDAQITMDGSGHLGATTAGTLSPHAGLTVWIDYLQAHAQCNSEVLGELAKLEGELA